MRDHRSPVAAGGGKPGGSAHAPGGHAMASRTKRAEIARETLTILEQGGYAIPGGGEVSIRAALDAARTGSALYTPDAFGEVFRRRDALLR